MTPRLKLPDPGYRRYWDIAPDGEHYTLTLRAQLGARVDELPVYRWNIVDYGEQDAFSAAAFQLIAAVKVRSEVVGQYKFNEEK